MTKNGTGFNVDIKQVDLDSSLPQDVEVKQQVDKHVGQYDNQLLFFSVVITKDMI